VTAARPTLCFLCCLLCALSVCGSVAVSRSPSSSSSWRAAYLLVVDLRPFFTICILPIVVSSDAGRCFRTRFAVRPGQVRYWLLLIALIQVDFGGYPAQACKYCTSWHLVGWL